MSSALVRNRRRSTQSRLRTRRTTPGSTGTFRRTPMRPWAVVLFGVSVLLAFLPSVYPELNAPLFYGGAAIAALGGIWGGWELSRKYELTFRRRVRKNEQQIRIRLANPPDDCDDQ